MFCGVGLARLTGKEPGMFTEVFVFGLCVLSVVALLVLIFTKEGRGNRRDDK